MLDREVKNSIQVMNQQQIAQPLGEILEQSGLISPSQLQVALYDRNIYEEMRIGEILVYRGWIEQNTADFFADQWSNCVAETDKYPLGFYLQKAGLLTYKQTEQILKEQPQSLIRFGALAVIKGWIQQKTLDFFLINLFPIQATEPSTMSRCNAATLIESSHRSDLIVDEELDYKPTVVDEIDYDDIPWVD